MLVDAYNPDGTGLKIPKLKRSFPKIGTFRDSPWSLGIEWFIITSNHMTAHRQPGLRSVPSRSRVPPLAILASSSSIISCGLIVMWTTCGVSPVENRESTSNMVVLDGRMRIESDLIGT